MAYAAAMVDALHFVRSDERNFVASAVVINFYGIAKELLLLVERSAVALHH
jgi:hypothetical protein